MKNFYKNASFCLKDKQKRNLFSKNEVCLFSYNLLLESSFSKAGLKNCIFSMNNQFLNHSLIAIENRCLITGKSKSIYKEFRLSRVSIRKAADSGLISGVKRSN